MLLVLDINHQRAKLLTQPGLQRIDSPGAILLELLPVLGDFNGLAVVDIKGSILLYIISKIKSHRDNLYKGLAAQFLLCLESDPEDTLYQGAQLSLVPVVAFGHHTEVVLVFQYIDRDIKNIHILAQFGGPIALTKYGENLQTVQKEGQEAFVKDIGPGQKHHVARRRKKNDQRIHQGILVVGGKYHRSIPWNVLLPPDLHPAVIVEEKNLGIGMDEVIDQISYVDASLSTPDPFLGHLRISD